MDAELQYLRIRAFTPQTRSMMSIPTEAHQYAAARFPKCFAGDIRHYVQIRSFSQTLPNLCAPCDAIVFSSIFSQPRGPTIVPFRYSAAPHAVVVLAYSLELSTRSFSSNLTRCAIVTHCLSPLTHAHVQFNLFFFAPDGRATAKNT